MAELCSVACETLRVMQSFLPPLLTCLLYYSEVLKLMAAGQECALRAVIEAQGGSVMQEAAAAHPESASLKENAEAVAPLLAKLGLSQGSQSQGSGCSMGADL